MRHPPGMPLGVDEDSRRSALVGRTQMSSMDGDLSGRTFLVTGGNTGIGLATARALARRGGRVCIACRSEQKGQAAPAEIAPTGGTDQVRSLPLDLADLASGRASAQASPALGEPLDVLINNAGV